MLYIGNLITAIIRDNVRYAKRHLTIKQFRKEVKERMNDFVPVRMMTTEQACKYTGMGKTKLRVWGKEIGAARKFGKALRFDKEVIDDYYRKMREETEV